MNKREKLILIVSIIAGLLAAMLTFGEIRQLKAKNNPGTMKVVIVTKKTIYPGEEIKRDNLVYSTLPERYFSRAIIKKGEEDVIIGAIARREIEANKPINKCQIIPYGGKEYYISKLPPGETPLTITIDPDLQLGGIVKRGSRVDLYLFSDNRGGMLIPIVGNVKVVWIENNGNKMDLTLALSDSDLYKVMLARSRGVLWVFPSRGKLPSKPISWTQLMGLEKRKKLPGVQILRGR